MRVPDTGSIEILGMRFHAFHGCLPYEKTHGNDFLVDFRCNLDLSRAAKSDRLEDTVDYSEIYRIVAAQMAVPSELLENVAGRIRDAIEEAIPEIPEFEVSVSKLDPPVGGPAAMAKVTLKGGRGR